MPKYEAYLSITPAVGHYCIRGSCPGRGSYLGVAWDNLLNVEWIERGASTHYIYKTPLDPLDELGVYTQLHARWEANAK